MTLKASSSISKFLYVSAVIHGVVLAPWPLSSELAVPQERVGSKTLKVYLQQSPSPLSVVKGFPSTGEKAETFQPDDSCDLPEHIKKRVQVN